MLSKNTILKAIHNQDVYPEALNELRMLSKNTILKAIHNLYVSIVFATKTANAK